MKHLTKFALAALLITTVTIPAHAQIGIGGSASGSVGTSAGTTGGVGGTGIGANVGINSGLNAGVNGTTNPNTATSGTTTDRTTIGTTSPRSTIGTTTSGAANAGTSAGTASGSAATSGNMDFNQFTSYIGRNATAGTRTTTVDARTRFNRLDTNNDNFISQTELSADAAAGVNSRTN